MKETLCFIDIEISKAYSFAVLCFIDKEKVDDIKNIEDIKPYCKMIDITDNEKVNTYIKYIIDKNIKLIGFNIARFDIPILSLCAAKKCTNEILYNIIKDNIISKQEGEDEDDNNNNTNLQQYIIDNIITQNDKEKTYTFNNIIKKITTIDLYLLNNWDDDSRRASLKWIACNLNSNNIVENPIPPDKENLTKEEKITFVKYCVNDILETIRVYKYSRPLIHMRESVYDIYKNYMRKNTFYNCSNTAMGAKMIEIELKKRYNIDIREKQQNSKEKVKYIYNIKEELLFENVKQYITENPSLYEGLKGFIENTIHRNLDFSYTYIFNNSFDKEQKTVITLGKGGGHGLMSNGIFYSDEETILLDFDVSGYYPEIVIQNKIYPVNIGPVFIDLYKYLKETRKTHPKGTPLNKAYKECMNAVIGLSNTRPGSIVFDPSFFFKITINGQLQILILLHMISKNIPVDLIMFNTDGCTIRINKKDIEKLYSIIKEWTKKFPYELEYTIYDKILFEHINSYIAVSMTKTEEENEYIRYNEFVKDGYKYKVKAKGSLVPDKEDLELHKNTGMMIVPLCIYNLFVHNKPVMQTIQENKDIYLYTDMVRINKKTKIVYYDEKDETYKEYTGKVLRFIYPWNREKAHIYYRVGKNGRTLISKEHPYIKECNNINEVSIDDIDIQYYVSIVSSIVNKIFMVKHKNLFSI